MARSKADPELRAWLKSLEDESPFAQLHSFRSAQPQEPVPQHLRFAELYEAIVAAAPNAEDAILADIDAQLAAEPCSTPGRRRDPMIEEAMRRIERLIGAQNIGVRTAAAKCAEELRRSHGRYIETASLVRSYHRYVERRLTEAMIDAVVSGDEQAEVAALENLRARARKPGRRARLHKN